MCRLTKKNMKRPFIFSHVEQVKCGNRTNNCAIFTVRRNLSAYNSCETTNRFVLLVTACLLSKIRRSHHPHASDASIPSVPAVPCEIRAYILSKLRSNGEDPKFFLRRVHELCSFPMTRALDPAYTRRMNEEDSNSLLVVAPL